MQFRCGVEGKNVADPSTFCVKADIDILEDLVRACYWVFLNHFPVSVSGLSYRVLKTVVTHTLDYSQRLDSGPHASQVPPFFFSSLSFFFIILPFFWFSFFFLLLLFFSSFSFFFFPFSLSRFSFFFFFSFFPFRSSL